MSNKRNKPVLDYNIFHKTGEKVQKDSNIETLTSQIESLEIIDMSETEKLKEYELQICNELNEFMLLNEVRGLSELDYVDEYRSELLDFYRKFKDTHEKIIRQINEAEHKRLFPRYDETLERLRLGIRQVDIEKKRMKIEEKEERKARDEEERRIRLQELEERKIEREERRIREDREDRIRNEEKEKELERQKNIDMEREERIANEEENRKARIMSDEEKKLEKEKKEMEENIRKEKEKKDLFEKDCLATKVLINEIGLIAKNLKDIYNKDFSEVSDELLIENKKNIVSYNKVHFKLVDKITQLCSTTPLDYENREAVIDEYSKLAIHISKSHDKFVYDVTSECTSRNVNKLNIREDCTDSIELKKFEGYKSDIDIYTFQAEFERLYLKRKPKDSLPDYLKYNYLEGTALSLVKPMSDMDSIWNRLKEAFGDTKVLLHNKLKEINKFGEIWRIRDKEKLTEALAKLVYVMIELKELSEKHNIENNLYYGGTIDTIFRIIGYKDRDKFITQYVGSKLNEKDRWIKLTEFLKKKLKTQEEILLIEKSSSYSQKEKYKECEKYKEKSKTTFHGSRELEKVCFICEEKGHQVTRDHRGKYVIQYFCCKKFVEMSPDERFKLLRKKGLCHQCLAPGAPSDTSKHKLDCFSKYCCKDKSHEKHAKKKHILVCDEHKSNKENIDLLEEYKSRCILGLKEKDKLPEFSRQISFHIKLGVHHTSSNNPTKTGNFDQPDVSEKGIYILQTIEVNGQKFNLFFDNGCGDLCVSKSAIDRLNKLDRAKQVRTGPIRLFGVGNQSSVSEHGLYQVSLPMYNSINAVMSGICIDQLTAVFPDYPLNKVEKDIKEAFKASKKKGILPRLPAEIGGETDLMIGSQYFIYSPKLVFELPSGLRIYNSVFLNPDGTRGVVGGPHTVFTEVEKKWFESNVSLSTFCSQQLKLFKMGYSVSLDIPLLSVKEPKDHLKDHLVISDVESNTCSVNSLIKKSNSVFEEIERTGTECSFRCVNCRNCTDCKKNEMLEHVTIREEVEQDLIDKSIVVDLEKGEIIASLPFISDPTLRLAPSNEEEALKVYNSVVRRLGKNLSDKKDVIEAEKKLQNLGFVDFLENLTEEQKQTIAVSKVHYFIPWRPIWNVNSITTSCRLVFDATFCHRSGYSLNSLLVKGRNGMNKLVEILIRWLIHKFAFHTDISKMYNSVKLRESDWCYQLYLWDNNLSLKKSPLTKVIKTTIYGVRSSGNQAERGIRETGRLCAEEYPRASEVIHKDVYVDDCFSGENTWDSIMSTTSDLVTVLQKGGFSLKGFTFSGFDPPKNLVNEDDISIKVGGIIWHPKEDKISLDTSELNFRTKIRGKKTSEGKNVIPSMFDRRQCVGKVSEIHDILGLASPVIGGFKLDLRELVHRKLDWDDKIPEELKSLWLSNFDMIKDLSDIKWNRAVVPVEAVSLDVDTIDSGDASSNLACVAIHARFKTKNDEYSCQLLFARTKLVPEGFTQPRAELFAAALNASAGHVVKRSLAQYHKEQIKLIDSQVALHWINNENGVLKQWVRNQVIEINRLADKRLWRYVHTSNMIADIGTRKVATLRDVDSNSTWINGFDWMRKDKSEFPVFTVDEIKLDPVKVKELKEEYLKGNSTDLLWSGILERKIKSAANHVKRETELEKRYKFSNYVVDPNKFRLRTVVRVLALVLLFIKNMKKCVKATKNEKIENFAKAESCVENIPKHFLSEKYLVTVGKSYKLKEGTEIKCKPGLVITLTDIDISNAINYFFRKATLEIKQFVNPSLYQKISQEKDGILYHYGRILPSQKVTGKVDMSDVMVDLSESSFCVPITDSLSPIANSIVNEVHWYNQSAKHSGNETILRYAQTISYIIDGRQLVNKFKQACPRCRYLKKKSVEVAMGPVKDYNMSIAPAFYATQVDLCGPFSSYSSHNKRATVNIWMTVFCCCTTGATSIKIMDDYSTPAFLLAFIRFSSVYGYPKFLLPDEGSQLIKGCKSMQISFVDIQHRLNTEYGIQFESCPVGGHNMHGKVERKIRQVQESMRKNLQGNRLSILQWETLGDQIANTVNNLPLASVNVSADLEHLDLLTPNRLLLGRNNDRSPSGPLLVTNDAQKILRNNSDIYQVWFESWLISYVPKLMEHPKWFRSDKDIQKGDIVLFLRTEKEYSKQYQYGIVESVELGRDNKIRTVIVRYRNPTEKKNRTTRRAVRELVIIHHHDEISIFEELAEAAKTASFVSFSN